MTDGLVIVLVVVEVDGGITIAHIYTLTATTNTNKQ